MNLVKEIRTSSLLIKIYSINPDLVIEDSVSLFENKNDYEIREIVFNHMGAEQVDIYDISIGDKTNNLRSYSVL